MGSTSKLKINFVHDSTLNQQALELDLMLRTNMIVILIALVEKIISSFREDIIQSFFGLILNSGQMTVSSLAQRRLNNNSVS